MASTRLPPLAIRFGLVERAALNKAAKAQDRATSALARVILSDWLRDKGWLAERRTLPDADIPLMRPADSPTLFQASLAQSIAEVAHRDQVDLAGKPYFEHLQRVVRNLAIRWEDASEEEIAAAWLHDVMEDTDWDGPKLVHYGISQAVVSIVREVTRVRDVPYLQWIGTLAHSGSASALRVKLADNQDNSDPDRSAAIAKGATMLEKKYLPARTLLEAGLARIT